MSGRTAVIHVGTHKTGTTSLQYFLQTNLGVLARAGLAFSNVGWYGVVPGNHNVAWDLLGRGDGHLIELDAELSELQTSVVLSSEEFLLLYDQPERLDAFVERLRGHGFQPKILMYVRAQAEFAESMYVEQVKHGVVRALGATIDDVIAMGEYGVGPRTIPFRYDEAAERFAAAVGPENVLVRPYARAGDTMTIFHDFLASIEQLAPPFRRAGLELELAHPRLNESLSFGGLIGYAYVNLHHGTNLTSDADAFFAATVPDVPRQWLNGRYHLLSRDECVRFIETFGEHNRRVESHFGIRIPGTRIEELPSPEAPIWELSRSERAIYDRCLAAWLPGC